MRPTSFGECLTMGLIVPQSAGNAVEAFLTIPIELPALSGVFVYITTRQSKD